MQSAPGTEELKRDSERTVLTCGARSRRSAGRRGLTGTPGGPDARRRDTMVRMTPRELLDPDLVNAIEAVPFADIDAEILPSLRGGFEFPPSDAVERTDHVVPGDADVRVRVHRPKGTAGPLPCVYSMHGGGYVIGSYAIDGPLLDQLCPKLDFVGVSVDYRLAPETPYPGPLEDCYAGLRWIGEHAQELGIDPDRIGVMGISAGGGLAAALALLARDRGGPQVAFQLLDSPMLDDRQVTPSSRQAGLPVWSRESNGFGWRSYLGDLYGRADVPYTAAPARAEDLSGLPPRSCPSAPSTGSATRTSTTRYGSIRRACRPSCTSIPARAMAS